MGRFKARELAFKTLFQSERGASPVLEVWREVREELAAPSVEEEAVYGDTLDNDSINFAERLLTDFGNHKEHIDQVLGEVIEGWDFPQMAQTDLNLLRLAVTEILYDSNVPAVVTIETSVRLAKRFGGEESSRFVHGVLAKLYKELDEKPPAP